jgi:hypothetical protein
MVRQTQEGGGWFEGSWFSFNTITTIVKDATQNYYHPKRFDNLNPQSNRTH